MACAVGVPGRVGWTRLVGGTYSGGGHSASAGRVAQRRGDVGAKGPSSSGLRTGHTDRGNAASGGGAGGPCTAARLGRSPSSGGEKPAGPQGAGGIQRSGRRATMSRGRRATKGRGWRGGRDGPPSVRATTAAAAPPYTGGTAGGTGVHTGSGTGVSTAGGTGVSTAGGAARGPADKRPRDGAAPADALRGGCARRAHARRRCRRRHVRGREVDQNDRAASPPSRATRGLYGGAAANEPRGPPGYGCAGRLGACGIFSRQKAVGHTHAERGGPRTLSPWPTGLGAGGDLENRARRPPLSGPGRRGRISRSSARCTLAAARSPPPVRPGNVVQRRRQRLGSCPGRVAQPIPPVAGWRMHPRGRRASRDTKAPSSAAGLQRSSRGAGPDTARLDQPSGARPFGPTASGARGRGQAGKRVCRAVLTRDPTDPMGGAVGGAATRGAPTHPRDWRVGAP